MQALPDVLGIDERGVTTSIRLLPNGRFQTRYGDASATVVDGNEAAGRNEGGKLDR
jgi:hypothetical protein